MDNIEYTLEQKEREENQHEVSIFDVCQTDIYKEWAVNNVRGMNTSTLEAIIEDATNIHMAVPRPPRDIMDKALHSLGLDLNESVERQICGHTSFGGNFVNGERYVGTIRKDKEWKAFVKKMIG